LVEKMNTKKDFEATARIIARTAQAAREATEKGGAFQEGALTALSLVADGLAAQYGAENPRFDRARFFKACGLEAKVAKGKTAKELLRESLVIVKAKE
jgi:hypothetical protein